MPQRTSNAPTVFVIAKLIPPWSGAGCRTAYPVSANAQTLISSNQTNMLKRSPLSVNPTIAPRKASRITCPIGPASSKYRQPKTSAAVTSVPARAASAAPSGSTSSATPSATPCDGFHPPAQCTTS